MRTNGTRTIGSAESSARFVGGALGFSSTVTAGTLGGAAADTTGGTGGVPLFRSGWPAAGGGGAAGRTAPGSWGGVAGRTAGATGGRTTTGGRAIDFFAAPTGVK